MFFQLGGNCLGKEISAEEVLALMAAEDVVEPEDIFVEATLERLLTRLNLPLPPWLIAQ